MKDRPQHVRSRETVVFRPADSRPKSRLRSKLVLAGVLVLALLLSWWQGGRSLGPEPLVKGVPITRWLATTASMANYSDVAGCGSNAIPWLVAALKAKEGRLTPVSRKLWLHLPAAVKRRWPWPRSKKEMRQIAWSALRYYGDEARPWLPVLLAAAEQENNWPYAPWSMVTLLAVGGDAPEVVAFFRDRLVGPRSSPQLRSQALGTFHLNGWSPPTLHPLLVSLLPAHLPEVTNTVCNELLGISTAVPETASVIPLLIEMSRNTACPEYAWTALRRLGPAATPATPMLRELLRTGDSPGKAVAADVLRRIGPPASEALPDLEAAMSDPDAGVRAVAAAAWHRLGGDPSPAVSVLEEVVQNRHDGKSWIGPELWQRLLWHNLVLNCQQAAVWFLGDLGSDARSAVPILKERAKDAPDWLAALLGRALWRIEGNEEVALRLIRQSLGNRDYFGRVLACVVLAEMGAAAAPCLPDLEQACLTDLHTRRAARHAIRVIREAAAPSTEGRQRSDEPLEVGKSQ